MVAITDTPHAYRCKSKAHFELPPSPTPLAALSCSPASSQLTLLPRNPTHTRSSTHEQQRRQFLAHLSNWAVNHDSSPHFHGSIFVLGGAESARGMALGESVKCLVTEASQPNVRKPIVIRLFPPRKQNQRYSMVVRSGAGWLGAFDFFNRQHRQARLAPPRRSQSMLLDEKQSTTVQPLFHPFLRLPLEIQQMILVSAAGLSNTYRPGHVHELDHVSSQTGPLPSMPISLATLFKISPWFNQHLVLMVYSTVDFAFAHTGFTKFLWQCGPSNRARVKRLTFRFSQTALLHCIRWLAPDAVYELFQPRVYTHPHALQYVWRCQIQDLSKELHLAVLTFDVQNTPVVDIPMTVRILGALFGSVGCMRFTEAGVPLRKDDERLAGLKEYKSWRDMCRDYFERHRHKSTYMARDRRLKTVEKLEQDMNCNRIFFDNANIYTNDDMSTDEP